VNIWTDPWIPRESTRRPITPRGVSLFTRVSELIDPITRTWDEQLVTDVFWPEDAEAVLMIPTNDDYEDWPAWFYDSKGVFSIKLAYKIAIQLHDQKNGTYASTSSASNQIIVDDFKWERLWQLNVPNKIRMFLWRFTHNCLSYPIFQAKSSTHCMCVPGSFIPHIRT
jgi:hypothetical protein